MIWEFFVIGGLLFWILMGISVVGLILAIERESGGYATTVLIITLALVFLLGNFNPFPWIAAHSFQAVGLVLGYFALGGVWSTAKWYFYLLNLRDEYKEIKDKFFKRHKITDNKIPNKLQSEWEREFGYGNKAYPPKALNNKSRILLWMTYWPFSFVWTMINDPVKRAFRFMYQHMAGMLQGISNHVFKGVLVEEDDK